MLLHSIGPARPFHPGARRFKIDIEQEGDVGNTIANCKSVQLVNDFLVQLAGDALINSRGIKKTIGDDAFAPFQRRLDDFADELSAARFEKEQLGFGSHRRTLRRELQKFTNGFPDRRSARFARDKKRNSRDIETVGEELDLRRFSATFRAFKCDKRQTRHYDVDLQTKIDNCRTRLS